MNFLSMQQELANRLGAYNQTVTADATKLKRWLNIAQQYICGKSNWPFLEGYEILSTVTDITTGTVSVTAGTATLTFSAGPAASVAGRYIKFSSTDDWYQIESHTAASTSATISPVYAQTDDLSAGTFTIRKLLYATSTPLDSITTIKKTVNSGQLVSLNKRDADFFLPLYMDAGDPVGYITGPMDSSGNLQFSLASPPSSAFNLLITGFKKLSDLSADADVSVVPVRWNDGLLNIASYYGFTALNDTRAKTELELGELRIKDMARVYSTDLGRHRIMGAEKDSQGFGPVYTLPGDFGVMS